VPATLSGVAEGSGGGCNLELGFCGMSGKSGGRVGGLTGGGSGWCLSSSGLGMALVLEDMKLTRVEPLCSGELLSATGRRFAWPAAATTMEPEARKRLMPAAERPFATSGDDGSLREGDGWSRHSRDGWSRAL
jgi:hypothetical protein